MSITATMAHMVTRHCGAPSSSAFVGVSASVMVPAPVLRAGPELDASHRSPSALDRDCWEEARI